MDMTFKHSRWRMHRMGLVDFWYYLNEEFYFEDGHMLLRGSNGSGKSVTLQSIIPLLLDGNKSSERLDSFGSRARKMETYLIDEGSERNDRIAYLYLEFKRDDSDVYKTIGMGLRARKNKPLDSWYFVIEDNRRINYDIKLIDNNLTISKQSLKNIIGDQLIEHQKEYVSRVNKALFGFKNLDDYKETINLLVQLRSPKLSNSLKPTMINEILSNSLQPLGEEDLRPMSEAIANLDEIEDQLEILKQSHQASKLIFNYYDQYNYACLKHKSDVALNDLHILNDAQKMMDQIKDDKMKNLENLQSSKDQKMALNNENDILNDELKVIANPELFKLSEDLVNKKNELNIKTYQYDEKLNQEETKNDKYIDEKNILRKHEDKKTDISHRIDLAFNDLNDIQTHIDFDEHYVLKEALFENLAEDYDYTYVFNKIDKEIRDLNEALVIFSNIEKENMIIDRILNEIETKEYESQKVEDELEKNRQKLESAIETVVEEFALWNDRNEYLRLSSDTMLTIIDILQNFEVEDNYYKIDEMIYQEYIKLTQELISKKAKLETSLEDLKHQKIKLESELNHWQTLKDVIPEVDEYTKANREYLDNNGIKYRPFYTLLEYTEDLSDDIKNRFEEILSNMGILNALVVSEDNRYQVLKVNEGLADKYLFTNKDIDDLKICYIDETIDINMILDELGIDDSGIMLIGDIYQNGIITGTISKKEKSVYIGKLKREEYRLRMIDEINKTLLELNDKLVNFDEELLKINGQIVILDEERNKYPNKNILDEIKQDIYLKERHIEQINKLILENKQDLNIHRKKIYDMNLELTNISNRLGLNCLKETFESRKEYFMDYQKALSELKTLHISYIATYELYLNSQLTIENLEKDLDIIRYEKDVLDENIKKLNMEIAAIERQLKEAGFSDKKERIETIQKRLKEIVGEISYQDRSIGNLEMAIEQNDKDISDYESKISFAKERYETSYNAYIDEANLKYVSDVIIDIDKVQTLVSSKYPKLNKKESILNDFQTSFHTNKGSLNEYRLNLISIFKDSENERIDITARYQGINIKFKDLILKLEEDIEKQKLLFDERDRNLVEDILINSLSDKIRRHIQSSRRWIEKMNHYMSSMNTSSGLNLSLKWHAHQGLNDDELNSDELIKLLEIDGTIRKDSDNKRLSSHFRSKIKTARQLTEMEGNQYSFHQIIKNIMDYRTWFDFEIWYQKKGENKKELTNNSFFAFSGGEKAMAMYIPLFSAVAAKYDQANDDTPMIIALDEAFAGVDEKNINNLFGLIDKFNFDYIMNSQVLWGDYPSVKALAIHELFRPENARFVTVISYKWNGKAKKMVEDIWM